jgi:hypothetical protein
MPIPVIEDLRPASEPPAEAATNAAPEPPAAPEPRSRPEVPEAVKAPETPERSESPESELPEPKG